MTAGGCPVVDANVRPRRADELSPFKKFLASLVVAEPTAIVMYDSQRVLRQGRDGGSPLSTKRNGATASSSSCKRSCLRHTRTLSCSPPSAAPSMASRRSLSSLSTFDASAYGVAMSRRNRDVSEARVRRRQDHRRARVSSNCNPLPRTLPPDAVSALNSAFLDVETDLIAWTSELLRPSTIGHSAKSPLAPLGSRQSPPGAKGVCSVR